MKKDFSISFVDRKEKEKMVADHTIFFPSSSFNFTSFSSLISLMF